MNDNRIFFRRKLPHYQPSDASFFITFRLAGSLPSRVLEQLREERDAQLREVGQDIVLSNNIQRAYVLKFDDYLARASSGPRWLQDNQVAKIVADALHYWNEKRYLLDCYCIMPNHVHVLLSTQETQLVMGRGNLSYNLSPILHSIKRHTARGANRILCRSGAFWQHESFDHVIRGGREMQQTIWYVLHNPVKAGLALRWKEWKWSYVRADLIDDGLEAESPSKGPRS